MTGWRCALEWEAMVPLPAMLDLGWYVVKVLAVLGGAATGGFCSGLLLRLLVKFWLRRPVPRSMLIPVQILGAVALGLAVWLWLSSVGTSGPGGGGLFGFGSGSGSETGQAANHEKKESSGQTTSRDKTVLDASEIMRIEVLGGDRVHEQRFYLIDGNEEAKTLAELRQAILARQQQKDKLPLKGIEILFNENSVARNHLAMRNLEKLAKDQDLAVTFPKGSGP